MKHFDLFSGIGGFALAAKWAGWETIGFSEIDKYCDKLLKKRFPGVKNYGDIKSIRREISADIITGGFPCQPFSCAGRRRGKEDDRHLWPEMLRIISEVKPSWVVGENVAGIETIFEYKDFSEMEGKEYNSREEAEACFRGSRERTGTNMLYMVVDDLKKIGYEVQPFIIPACAVNAWHRRDRVWIVAYSGYRHAQGAENGREFKEQIGKGNAPESERPVEWDAERVDSDSMYQGLQRRIIQNGSKGAQSYNEQFTGCSGLWNWNWIEAATSLCGVDDGLSIELDELKLSKSKHRESRFKGLGNAIVPQAAFEIFKAVNEVEKIIKESEEK